MKNSALQHEHGKEHVMVSGSIHHAESQGLKPANTVQQPAVNWLDEYEDLVKLNCIGIVIVEPARVVKCMQLLQWLKTTFKNVFL